MNSDFRILSLSDVDAAAQVVSQAFVDDPLTSLVHVSHQIDARQDPEHVFPDLR